MKFGRFFESSIIPEWKAAYLDYKLLKKEIKICKRAIASVGKNADAGSLLTAHRTEYSNKFHQELEQRQERLAELGFAQAPNSSVSVGISLLSHGQGSPVSGEHLTVLHEVDSQFQDLLDAELDKVNEFYVQKEKQYKTTFDHLQTSLKELSATHSKAEFALLKSAFQEFYRAVGFLKNFSILNFTGFVKILKKYDKNTASSLGVNYLTILHQSEFVQTSALKQLESESEIVFAKAFCQGNKSAAMSDLRIQSNSKVDSKAILRAGILCGMCIILFIVVAYEYFMYWPAEGTPGDAYLDAHGMAVDTYLYRLAGFPALMLFLFAINVYIWERNHVNHVFIFELNPRNNLSVYNYFEISGVLIMLWLISAYFYVKSTLDTVADINPTDNLFDNGPDISQTFPPFFQPVILIIVYVALLALPFPWFYPSARKWFWKVIGRIIGAPFFSVKFADFFLADQLTSLSEFLFDFQFVICFVLTSRTSSSAEQFCSTGFVSALPIVSALPYWWRMMQCFRRWWDSGDKHPHLTNAGKYCSQLVAMVCSVVDLVVTGGKGWGSTKTAWLVATLFATCYKLWWDLQMDWGLFPLPSKNQNPQADDKVEVQPDSNRTPRKSTSQLSEFQPSTPLMMPVLIESKDQGSVITLRPMQLNRPVSMNAKKPGSKIPYLSGRSKSFASVFSRTPRGDPLREDRELESPSPYVRLGESEGGDGQLSARRSATSGNILHHQSDELGPRSLPSSARRIRPDEAVRSLIQANNEIDFSATPRSARAQSARTYNRGFSSVEGHPSFSSLPSSPRTVDPNVRGPSSADRLLNEHPNSTIANLREEIKRTKEKRKNKRYKFLRKHLMYEPVRLYYLAIIENSLFRFIWLFVFIAKYGFGATKAMNWVSLFTSVAEIFRRFVWNIFRLENEHMNNCDNFRAVKEIPIPMHRNSEEQESK